jgi:flagellar motor switch protein FliG
VQKDKIAMALKGASVDMKDLFFRNLSERASKMLREELENLGPVKLKDVDDARGELVRVAKDLAAQGRIEIKQAGEEEVVF